MKILGVTDLTSPSYFPRPPPSPPIIIKQPTPHKPTPDIPSTRKNYHPGRDILIYPQESRSIPEATLLSLPPRSTISSPSASRSSSSEHPQTLISPPCLRSQTVNHLARIPEPPVIHCPIECSRSYPPSSYNTNKPSELRTASTNANHLFNLLTIFCHELSLTIIHSLIILTQSVTRS